MGEQTPLDVEEFRRWRDEAEGALRGARVQREAALYNWACFQAEQAAQLSLKALLHGIGAAPWGHDLEELAERASGSGIDVPGSVRDVARRLGRHYIPARYPDAHPSGPASGHYGDADAEEAIRDAEAVLAFVDRAWEGLGG